MTHVLPALALLFVLNGTFAQAATLPATNDSASREVPPAPEEGGPRNWRVATLTGSLNLRASPSTTATILARYAPNTLLDNLGCLAAEGRAWCDVQALGGGPRGYVAAEFLQPARAPHGAISRGPDDSAQRAGNGDFDATGHLRCHRAGAPGDWCAFGVARSGGGYATVVVETLDGRSQGIYFRMGRAIGTATSQVYHPEFRAEREGDTTVIYLDNDRYEIPDAIVLGG